MTQNWLIKIFDLLLDLSPSDHLRIVDQQSKNTRLMDIALPQFDCEFVIATDLPGQLA